MSPDVASRRRTRLALAVAATALLLVIASVFLAPPALRWLAERQLSRALAAPVRIQGLRLSPLAATVHLTGVTVGAGPRDRPLLSVPGVDVAFRSGALWRGQVALSRIGLMRPEAWVELTPEGVAWLPPRSNSGSDRPGADVQFTELVVQDGRLHLMDRRREPFREEVVEEFRLRLRGASADGAQSSVFAGGRWRGMELSSEGWVRPATREFHLPLTLRGGDLGRLAALLPGADGAAAGAFSGTLDLRGRASRDVEAALQVEGQGLALESARGVTVRGDRFRARADVHWSPTAVRLPHGRLDVDGGAVRWGGRPDAVIGQLSIEGKAERDAQGVWHLDGTLAGTALRAPGPGGGVRDLAVGQLRAAFRGDVREAGVDLLGRLEASSVEGRTPQRLIARWRSGHLAAESARLQSNPFRLTVETVRLEAPVVGLVRAVRPRGPDRPGPAVRVGRVVVRDGTLHFTDTLRAGFSAAVSGVTGEIFDIALDSPRPMRGRLQGRERAGAHLTAAGQLHPRTGEGRLTVDFRDMDVLRVQAYYSPVVRRVVRGGSAGGTLDIDIRRTGGNLTSVARGVVTLAPLELGDVANRETLLLAERAEAQVERFSLDPPVLQVSAMAVSRPWIGLSRLRDGTVPAFRFLTDLRTSESAPTAGGGAGGRRIVQVERLALTDATLDIQDHAVRPPFRDRFEDLQAIVNNLGLPARQPVQVSLTGTLSDRSTVSARGQVVPGAASLTLDVEASIRDLNLPRLNPYTARLTSQRLDTGKLYSEVRYSIRGDRLEGENLVRIDQLRLREGSRAPDRFEAVVGMPLALAVSLLQDASGEIRLFVPVTGDLRNPRFDFRDAIGAAFRNAVVQIATAPLRLIGQIVTAGGRIGRIDIAPVRFTPGSARLDEAAEAQVDKLAAVLRERPGLKIKLAAVGDLESDAEGLRAEHLEQQLLALGGDQERGAAVEELFQRAFGQAGPSLPIADQLQRLLAAQTVTRRELRALVDLRGLAVYDALVARGIARDRIFLGPGRMVTGEDGPGQSARRTDVAFLSAGELF